MGTCLENHRLWFPCSVSFLVTAVSGCHGHAFPWWTPASHCESQWILPYGASSQVCGQRMKKLTKSAAFRRQLVHSMWLVFPLVLLVVSYSGTGDGTDSQNRDSELIDLRSPTWCVSQAIWRKDCCYSTGNHYILSGHLSLLFYLKFHNCHQRFNYIFVSTGISTSKFFCLRPAPKEWWGIPSDFRNTKHISGFPNHASCNPENLVKASGQFGL